MPGKWWRASNSLLESPCKSEWTCEWAFSCHSCTQAGPRYHNWYRLSLTCGSHETGPTREKGQIAVTTPCWRIFPPFPCNPSLPSSCHFLPFPSQKHITTLFNKFKKIVCSFCASPFKSPEARDHKGSGWLIRIREGKHNKTQINTQSVVLLYC